VMVEFNDRPVRTQESFLGELRGVKPGEKVTVRVQRGGSQVDVPVTIGTRPS
jgi:S1-C subfamily serine protease